MIKDKISLARLNISQEMNEYVNMLLTQVPIFNKTVFVDNHIDFKAISQIEQTDFDRQFTDCMVMQYTQVLREGTPGQAAEIGKTFGSLSLALGEDYFLNRILPKLTYTALQLEKIDEKKYKNLHVTICGYLKEAEGFTPRVRERLVDIVANCKTEFNFSRTPRSANMPL